MLVGITVGDGWQQETPESQGAWHLPLAGPCQGRRVATTLPQRVIGETSPVILRALLEPSTTDQWV